MNIRVTNTNGLRRLSFAKNNVDEHLPQQAIVHANLGHVKTAKKPDFDFGTVFLELTEYRGKTLLEDSFYRTEQVKEFAKKIKNNPDKMIFFAINGAKTSLKFTRDANKTLIDFQVKCGFKYVKAFIKYNKNAVSDYNYYRSLVPKHCKFVAQIDENLNHTLFKEIYRDCYEKKHDKVICFFGRKPSKTQRYNRFNFNFIRSKRKDAIIRFITSTARSDMGVPSSLVYYYYGFDVFSILARRWNPDMPDDLELEVLDGLVFTPLTKNTKSLCLLRNESLYDSVQHFKNKYNRESLPVTVYNIHYINQLFRKLHRQFSANDLRRILADRIV